MNNLNLDEALVRQRIKAAFDEMSATKSVSSDIAFHLTDWVSDIEDLIKIYSNIEKLSNDEITSFIYKFLAHVPNHLNAATKLSGLGPIKDVFEVRIFEDDI
ncbi:MAG TPA: hypothetical protein VIL74_05730 [Pyrinomonadaceae bacterium]|jgi:hypothetical protein